MGSSILGRTLLALALLGVASPAVCADPEEQTSAFRLGNAAMPFGWSTAVGDFNRDGKADLAIADETGRRPAGYAYRIELALSGSARYDVTFETAQAAVAISVADIDGDRDVDLLLTVPLSDRRIGIFLNDGRGQFRSADVGLFPAAKASEERLRPPPGAPGEQCSAVSPKRASDLLLPHTRVRPRDAVARVGTHGTGTVWRQVHASPASPRGPPQLSS